MNERKPVILMVEPYYGGSHRTFIDGLCAHLDFDFTLLTLPARKWKTRMQLAAPLMASRTLDYLAKRSADLILCSSMLDVAAYRSILAGRGITIPLALYVHENQFAYPSRQAAGMRQFMALNFTSALAADRIAFNSRFNRDTFLAGVGQYLGRAGEIKIPGLVEELAARSSVLHPGIDFGQAGGKRSSRAGAGPPVIVWNHRWEHDKDPETFFQVLFELMEEGAAFRLVVLGECFASRPAVFGEAERRLAGKILHFGYARDREEYCRWLQAGDIVVSTARHEFFGISVLEAVRCGCRPLVPDRLVYPELFPERFRYPENGLAPALAALLRDFSPLGQEEGESLTARYSWPAAAPRFAVWLQSLLPA